MREPAQGRPRKVSNDPTLPEPASVKVRVAEGTQLSYDDRLYAGGAEIEAPAAIAERWIVRGWAEPTEPREPKPASGSSRADVAASATSRSRRSR